MKATLADILNATGAVGDLPETDVLIERVSTDSRLVERGDLFFCLPGDRFDGHAFAGAASARGAAAIVAERPVEDVDCPVLMVRDSLMALGALAAWRRSKTRARVVGVTGTAGKTTVKEWIAQLCATQGVVHRNYLNLNNLIGLPLSILNATGEEDFWVLEAGISVPGEMDRLAGMLRPDLALIVNVGPAHLEGLGSVRGVAEEKVKLIERRAAGGLGVVNFDYPELREAAGPGMIGFSTQGAKGARYHGAYLGPESRTSGLYRLDLDGENVERELPWRGGFALENALAAAAAAHCLGVPTTDIVQTLGELTPARQRFVCRAVGDLLLIDDSYNANPMSMPVVIEAARDMAGDRPLVFVLGEMRELGAMAARAHEELGRRLASAKGAAVYWKGGFASEVERGLRDGGYEGLFELFEEPGRFMECFRSLGLRDAAVLVKGSRANRLETVTEALLKECD